MLSPRRVCFLLTWILILPLVQCLCYFPAGNVASQDSPCQDGTDHSTCCGQGYACLSNNMCMATGKELQKDGATIYVRGSCTDKNWRSSSCPLFCSTPDLDNVSGGQGIGQCEGTKGSQKLFYCVNSNKVDCDKQENVLLFQEEPTAYTTIGVLPTTTSIVSSTSSESRTISTSSSSSISPSATSANTSSSEPTPAALRGPNIAVGVGVGLGVGIPALIAAIVIGILIHRRRSARAGLRENETTYVMDPYQQKAPGEGIGSSPSYSHQGHGRSKIYEVPDPSTIAPADLIRHELPGESGNQPDGHAANRLSSTRGRRGL